jgi:hypothetical protein
MKLGEIPIARGETCINRRLELLVELVSREAKLTGPQKRKGDASFVANWSNDSARIHLPELLHSAPLRFSRIDINVEIELVVVGVVEREGRGPSERPILQDDPTCRSGQVLVKPTAAIVRKACHASELHRFERPTEA